VPPLSSLTHVLAFSSLLLVSSLLCCDSSSRPQTILGFSFPFISLRIISNNMNVLKSLVKGITLSSHKEEKVDEGFIPPPAQPHNPNSSSSEEELLHDDTQEDRKKLWSKVSGLVGKDTTSLLSLPVSLFEPTSVLQTMVEPLRYAELLEEACKFEDPVDRLCRVAAFGVALFSNYTRTLKPFNPVLGETFEFVHQNQKYKSLCEQVSHHPPVGIAHTMGEGWTLQQESHIEAWFWGNSVDISSIGNNHFWISKTGDHYTWMNPMSCVHNIIFGRLWIEHCGDQIIKSLKTKHTAVVHFKKAGWFEGINYEVHGEVKDGDGRIRAIISGKWNEYVAITKVDDKGNKLEPIVLWRKPIDLGETTNKWKWGRFVYELTATDEEAILPPTDSRLRGDLRALASLNMKLAAKEKNKIEDRERQKRRERDAQGKKWSPVYFKKITCEECDLWEFSSNYWEEREIRVQQQKEKTRQIELKVMSERPKNEELVPPPLSTEVSIVENSA